MASYCCGKGNTTQQAEPLLGFDDGNTTKTINIETITKVEFRNGSFGWVLAGVGPDY
jgi:hypothetical protein